MGWGDVGTAAAQGLQQVGETAQKLGRKGRDAVGSFAGGIEAAVGKVKEAVNETKQDLLDKQRKIRPKLEGVTDRSTGPVVNPSTGSVPTSYSLKRGGRIPKTGVYQLHKGEFVIPDKVMKRVDKGRKATRKSGRR